MRLLYALSLSTVVMVTATSQPAMSQVITWDNGGTGISWATPQNWSGDVVPTASDTVRFNDTGSVGSPSTITNILDDAA